VFFDSDVRRLARCAVLLVAACSAPAFGQTGSAPLLTLDEATRLAVAQSRLVKIAQIEVGKAASDLAALTDRRRPNVDVQMLSGTLVAPMSFLFTTGSLGTYPATGPIPMSDTTITTDPRFAAFVSARVAQPLTQLKTIGWGQRALSVGQDLAREQVRAQEQTVRNNVKKLYFGLLQAESGLAANAEAITLYRELDRLVSDYVARQVALPAEGLTVRAGLAKYEQSDVVIRNTIATLKEQLNVVLGRDITTDFSVGPGPADLSFNVDLGPIEKRAVEQRPEVRQARLRAQQAEYDLQRTRSAAIPELSVVFNYFGFYNVEVLPRNVAAVGILGSWEPWDWGRKKQEQAAKGLVVEQAQMGVREAEDSVRVDVRQHYRKVQEARAMLNVAELGRQTAREKLRVATEQYRLEASLRRQLLEAQAALADSDQQYQQALAAYWTARADLDKAIGDDQ
jgi:outer membrane protein TolC